MHCVSHLTMLAVNKYDAVFLDYDFDEEKTGVNGTGGDIVAYIVAHADRFKDTHLFVHSLNEEGRKKMCVLFFTVALPEKQVPWAWQYISPEKLKDMTAPDVESKEDA